MPKVGVAKTKLVPKGGNEGSPGAALVEPSGGVKSPVQGIYPRPPRRKTVILYICGFAIALFAVLAPTFFYQPATAQLKLDGKTISLEIASSDAARQKGLGGRQSLAPDKGMVFVFASPGRQCFWMKDMHFPIDMIFVSARKQIVKLQTDISVQSYPKDFCADNSQYVIELNAGSVTKLGLHTGQQLSF